MKISIVGCGASHFFSLSLLLPRVEAVVFLTAFHLPRSISVLGLDEYIGMLQVTSLVPRPINMFLLRFLIGF